MFKKIFKRFKFFQNKKNGLEKICLPLEIEKIILSYKKQLETNPLYEDLFQDRPSFDFKDYTYKAGSINTDKKNFLMEI